MHLITLYQICSELVLPKLIVIDQIVKLVGNSQMPTVFLRWNIITDYFKLQGDASGKPTPQAQDQKVLADFFNQLLAKRPAGSKSSSLVSSKSPSTENPSKKDKPAS